MKKAEFMQEFVGQEFDGVISSVVKFGLFVELPNTVEGLIHITNLPEFFHYNERTLSLHGEKSGLVFRVGQPIRIQLTRADKLTGEIDFAHVASDLDIFEKGQKREKKETFRKSQITADSKKAGLGRKNDKKASAGKSAKNKKFYKEVAKKGGKHGQGRRKSRRAK